uniref:Transcription factor IIA, alpha/beta subunit n=1 Tax=Micromonas pusilla TaxID=38833 RepID=A0A6U0MRU5_MICPS|mmetsp:Transcript_11225/g.46836  ORF Transcript_11225/g.46836 Transcript_11225/m.46836 type:complete len:177 (+) Transcript_11225:156-686(+)
MDVAGVYLQVMRSVIDGVRADFSTEQLDEASLDALAKLWERKVLETRTLLKETVHVTPENAPKADTCKENNRNVPEHPVKAMSSPEKQDGFRRGKNHGSPVCEADGILSSDSDDENDDDRSNSQHLEDGDGQNLILAQFEKVARAKSKWKCTLKEGTMTLKGKDSLFGRAGGEFTW